MQNIHRLVKAFACSAAVWIGTTALSPAIADSGNAQDFLRLVTLSAERLALSSKVALTKWDTGLPVADPPGDPREREVLAAAAAAAAAQGLSPALATSFFADQIEASKLLQYSLMAGWRRTGIVPDEPRADLRTELRPALDRLRGDFLAELIRTGELRASKDCRRRLAVTTASYAQARSLPSLFAIALDRGLASACDA